MQICQWQGVCLQPRKINDLAGAVNVNADNIALCVEVYNNARGDFERVFAVFFRKDQSKASRFRDDN